MNDDEIRALFEEMREEAVPADSLARLRMAVASGTQPSRRKWWWAAFAIAAACCGIALLAVLFQPALPIPPAPAPIAARQMPPEVPMVSPGAPVAPVAAPKMRRVVHRVPVAPPPRLPGTVVRIETNDPNVVILLVG